MRIPTAYLVWEITGVTICIPNDRYVIALRSLYDRIRSDMRSRLQEELHPYRLIERGQHIEISHMYPLDMPMG